MRHHSLNGLDLALALDRHVSMTITGAFKTSFHTLNQLFT